MRLEDSDKSWTVYLSRWIFMLNEYKIFVNIFESYNLFVWLTYNDSDKFELKKSYAEDYDSHPSIYERILEIESKCNNNSTLIELNEYDLDSFLLSKHFWNLYRGENIHNDNIPIYDNCRSAMEELSRRLTIEYRNIFECFTYAELSPVIVMYSQISYNLYHKTKNDVFEY